MRFDRPMCRVPKGWSAAVLAAALLLGTAVPAQAQVAADPATVDLVYQNFLQLRIGAFEGLMLVQGGRELDPGYFCGDCETILAGSPRALDAASTFGSLRIAGTVVYSLGAAVMLSGAILPLVDPTPDLWLDENWAVFTGLVVSGSVVAVVGGILLGIAPAYMSDAVLAYNDDVYITARSGGTLPLGAAVVPIRGGAALATTGRF